MLQSPKYGRSPLRAAMRALLISKRSSAPIRRPNMVLDEVKWVEEVLDIWVPLFGAAVAALRSDAT
jgi:hypothetical protein